MITLDTRYKTRDGEFSATHDEAVDHCLTTAHLQLIALLEDAGVDGAYRYAQKIVNNLYEGKNADSLNNTAAWVADALADSPTHWFRFRRHHRWLMPSVLWSSSLVSN